jgi:hypothetical protein
VLGRGDREGGEATRGAWAERLLGATPEPAGGEEAIARAGNTRRGSQQQGAPGGPRLAGLAPRVGFTLAHQAVDEKTQARPGAVDLLRPLGRAGRRVPLDAWRTPRQMARQLVEAGGASVMVVQEHQPQCMDDSAPVVAWAPRVGAQRPVATTGDRGHGRIAQRALQPRHV